MAGCGVNALSAAQLTSSVDPFSASRRHRPIIVEITMRGKLRLVGEKFLMVTRLRSLITFSRTPTKKTITKSTNI